MNKIQITSRWTGETIFDHECEDNTVRKTLESAVEQGANLGGANLIDANLRDVDLRGADLRGAKSADLAIAQTRILPDGDIVGYKKCQEGLIVKLLIPKEAKRSHAFGRKCRAEYADVIEITDKENNTCKKATSDRGGEYITGKRIYPDSFDENWQDECSNGIHFFITKEEAEAW